MGLQLHPLWLAAVVIGGSMLLATAGLLGVRRFANVSSFPPHHQVSGNLLSIMGTLYAVVLGFVVVDVSNDAQSIRDDIANEANAVLNIARLSSGLPVKVHKQLATSCRQYCLTVAEEEWPAMAHGVPCRHAWDAMVGIWKDIKGFAPETPQEQAFYGAILSNYTDMMNGRRVRLFNAHSRVSIILWVIIITGGIITIVFTYLFMVKNLKFQILMTNFVALTLSLNIYLVVVSARPLTGGFRISPVAFQIAAKIIDLDFGSGVGK